jgi:predicted alpha-1,2-mannosidase
VICPQVGEPLLSPHKRSFAYNPEDATFKPNVFAAESIRDKTRIEVVPTERGAILRFTFQETKRARVIVQAGEGESWIRINLENRSIEGVSRVSSGGAPERFGCYFVAKLDRSPISGTVFDGSGDFQGIVEATGKAVGVALEFPTFEGEAVCLRVATSFISLEQAWHNFSIELEEQSFEELAVTSADAWTNALSKIIVESDSSKDLATFYSCLYRTMLFPRTFHEPNPEGGFHHYSPYSGLVHEGTTVTDNGFWDTYRTVYPLLALISPVKLGEILSGWINAFREGGWFPQWASPGYRACMVGTHIDAVFADAAVRGIQGFDLETAYQGMRKHAFEVGDAHGAYGRLGIKSYLEKGYVPDEEHEGATARSLDYAYDDFCLGQIARILGHTADAKQFDERAQNYRKLYDPEVGFMRGKTDSEEWAEPWGEFLWGGSYVEGGPWQSTWAVPHDVQGLIDLMGGRQKFVQKLETMLHLPPLFEVGSYGFEIHEMTEMACAKFGQYAHSNQPVHHVLYLFAAAGEPWKTQEWVRKAMAEMYSPTDLPGDEDNGEMCAWYILSALGLFPACPGHPSYTIGSPLFRRISVKREGLPDLTIESHGEGIFVDRLSVDGVEHSGLSIGQDLLCRSSKLDFELTVKPRIREIDPKDLPFSVSTIPE